MKSKLKNFFNLQKLHPAPPKESECSVVDHTEVKPFKFPDNVSFKTTHVDRDNPLLTKKYFKLGTIEGTYGYDDNYHYILSIENHTPGNGHFSVLMDYLEHICKEDGKDLVIGNIYNPSFFSHLVKRRGFRQVNSNTALKFVGA